MKTTPFAILICTLSCLIVFTQPTFAAAVKAADFNGVAIELPDRWQVNGSVVTGPNFMRVQILDTQKDANVSLAMLDPELRFADVNAWVLESRIPESIARYASQGKEGGERTYFDHTVTASTDGVATLGSGEVVKTRDMTLDIKWGSSGTLRRHTRFAWFECGIKVRWCLLFVYNTPRTYDHAKEFSMILKSVMLPRRTESPRSAPPDYLAALPDTSWTASWGGPRAGQVPVTFKRDGESLVAQFPGNFTSPVEFDGNGRIRFKNRMGFELVVPYSAASVLEGKLLGPSWDAPLKLTR